MFAYEELNGRLIHGANSTNAFQVCMYYGFGVQVLETRGNATKLDTTVVNAHESEMALRTNDNAGDNASSWKCLHEMEQSAVYHPLGDQGRR